MIYEPQTSPKKPSKLSITIILVAVGCLIVTCMVAGGILALQVFGNAIANQGIGGDQSPTAAEPFITPSLPGTSRPMATAGSPGSTAAPHLELSLGAIETAASLRDTLVPIEDPYDIAARLQGKNNVPRTIQTPARQYKVGDEEQFWVMNSDTDKQFKTTAVLAFITDHLYLWVAKDITGWKTENARTLAERFEKDIYPTDREFFGSEWSPGIDNDPHLFVLFARGIGSRVAGYFSPEDEINPLIDPYSNGHEMFVMNIASFPQLVNDYAYTTLAHEFQHMIHWYRDPNEESWINEGFSELAAFLNSFGVGGHDLAFASQPDLQLNDWPNDKTKTLPHYGAAFLFLDYFLNRAGEPATRALVGEPENGLASVDKVLADFGLKDSVTGLPISADDLFADWVVANYLQDKNVGDGRFYYANYPAAPHVPVTEKVTRCPTGDLNRTVSQYGADYIRISCRGMVNLSFSGSQEAKVIPAGPHSGSYYFWSNKGDVSDMTLTQTFDFTSVSAPIPMSYWTWYDLEKNYDYVYLEASTDGVNWQILPTTTGTKENIAGKNLGTGYNGVSKTWIEEKIDLSQFAGAKVQLRFEYLTDGAVNGEGFLLDDMSIPAIQYSTDFEKDNGGWTAQGFVRMQESIPQTFRVSLIYTGNPARVEMLPVSDLQTLSLSLDLKSDVILVVSGTTRFTRQVANYTLSLAP